MSTVKAVLLDFDGTLAQTLDSYHLALNLALNRIGLPSVKKEVVTDVIRAAESGVDALQNLVKLVPHTVKERKTRAMKLINEYRNILPMIDQQHTVISSESRKVLSEIAKKFEIAIVTTRFESKSVLAHLQKYNIANYVKKVVTAKDATAPKPSPEQLIVAIKRLRVKAEECVMVGDSPRDIQAGKAAKMRTVAVTTGVWKKEELLKENPDAVVARITELPEILEKWRRSPDQRRKRKEEWIIIKGRVTTGIGGGRYFTQLMWARKQFIERLNFDPYPGTLNLKLEDEEDLQKFTALRKMPGIEIKPKSKEYCIGKCFMAIVENTIKGAVVIPLIEPYNPDILEVLSPIGLRDALKLNDGDIIKVRIQVTSP